MNRNNAPETRTVDASWELARGAGKIGTGNWIAFPHDKVALIESAAATWRECLQGIEKPWLCWCVDDEWCHLQQQLVKAVGWTPIVGTDGRVPKPKLVQGAVFIDFNDQLKLPSMWMHFPLEFAYLYCDKLAYWHSDVLPPVSFLQQIADRFEQINNGELIGVKIGRIDLGTAYSRWKRGVPPFFKRWFEVIGCTTHGASRSQFENGCGWWRNPHLHPNAKHEVIKSKPHWEHGVGIWFWETYFEGRAINLDLDIEPYHYSTNKRNYQRRRGTDGELADGKQEELRRSFDLTTIVENLELTDST